MAKKRKNCRNCPDEGNTVLKPETKPLIFVNKYKDKVLDERLVKSETESQRLWNHVLFGTSTCIQMIHGYASLGLPGDAVPQIDMMISKLVEARQIILGETDED